MFTNVAIMILFAVFILHIIKSLIPNIPFEFPSLKYSDGYSLLQSCTWTNLWSVQYLLSRRQAQTFSIPFLSCTSPTDISDVRWCTSVFCEGEKLRRLKKQKKKLNIHLNPAINFARSIGKNFLPFDSVFSTRSANREHWSNAFLLRCSKADIWDSWLSLVEFCNWIIRSYQKGKA